jgi:hypothetical protein
MTSGIYFSAADRQATRFQGKDAVRRTLLLSLLFQQKIVVPDIFFFICQDFFELAKDPDSLLSAGLEEGHIRPAFRIDDIAEELFKRSLTLIESQGIRGLLERDQRKMLAAYLDNCVQRAIEGKSYSRVVWPEESAKSVAKGYSALLHSRLITGTLPSNTSPLFEQYWALTSRWRREWLQEAIDLSPVPGVRRGDIMRVVGQHLGLTKGVAIDDYSELLDASLDAKETTTPQQRTALWHFLRWINEAYYINQAEAFEASALIPSYHPLSPCVLTREMPIATTQETLELALDLPPVDYLLSVPGRTILKIRGEEGAEYLAALEIWQKYPSSLSEANLRERAEAYARRISKGTQAPRVSIGAFRASVIAVGGSHTLSLLGLLPKWGEIVTGIASGIAAVTEIGCVVYKWSLPRTVDTSIVIGRQPDLPVPQEGDHALVLPPKEAESKA